MTVTSCSARRWSHLIMMKFSFVLPSLWYIGYAFQASPKLTKLTLNFRSSCLYHLSSGITGVHHSPGLCCAEAQPKGNQACIHACIHRLNCISSSLWDLRGLELGKENLCFSKTVPVRSLLFLGMPSGSREGAAQGRERSFWPWFEGKCMKGWCGSRTPRRLAT